MPTSSNRSARWSCSRRCRPCSGQHPRDRRRPMRPSEMPASSGEVQRQLEMAQVPLVPYARDLTRWLERERDKTRELTAERTLLEQPLQGRVKVLTDILALVSPMA